MRIERQVFFWLLAALGLALFLYLFSGILLPFVAALILGYLLDPVADRLEKAGLGRLGAALAILAAFTIIFVLLLILFVPVLVHQFTSFIDGFPALVTRLQGLAAEQGGALGKRLAGGIFQKLGLDADVGAADIQGSLGNLVGQGSKYVLTFLQSLWAGGQTLVGVFSLLVVTPVVAFYIQHDWDKMIASIDSYIPIHSRATVHELAREIDVAIAGFLRGQSLVCLFLGLWYGIGLTLVGLNFGFLIGITAGFLSFIPYVGSLTALILSAIIAIVQGWPSWWLLVMSSAVVGTGQFLEGNFLTPRLVGASVGLHPVWVMFALFAFGALFGFTGLILAVPVAAAIGVLVRFGLRRYRTSDFYRSASLDRTRVPLELP
jgi:predicted PurR-regulated permease PerM